MESNIIILDGALGTLLCDTTSPEAANSPLWSAVDLLRNPTRLSDVHKQYIASGAQYISTATYQLSRNTFSAVGITDEEEISEISRKGMSVALEALQQQGEGKDLKVVLSLGPFGSCLQPSQEYSGIYPIPYKKDWEGATSYLREWHEQRLRQFSSHPEFKGIGVLAFETVPCSRVDEVTAIRQVIDTEEFRYKTAWISIVYPDAPDRTTVRDLVREVFKEIPAGSSPRGIGINCTKLALLKDIVAVYSEAVKEMGLPRNSIFLVLYPDGGLTYDVTTKSWSDKDGMADIKAWCENVMDIVKAAAKEGCWHDIVVGGCCKTTPGHIEQLKRLNAS
ncbi:hypothetical protein ABW19_dt0205647 [Dactylella cylindrospora]|nr:hypothetical protein ABW19_dt0205647 [Dactylella cylindrospora]